MHVYICLDLKNGMLFHRRRQSRDRAVLADLAQCVGAGRLLAAPFSARLFEGGPAHPEIRADFLSAAGSEDSCFVEDAPLLPYLPAIRSVTVYRWNRNYPADVRLDLQLDAPPWRLTSAREFPGYSHELLTREVYFHEYA